LIKQYSDIYYQQQKISVVKLQSHLFAFIYRNKESVVCIFLDTSGHTQHSVRLFSLPKSPVSCESSQRWRKYGLNWICCCLLNA